MTVINVHDTCVASAKQMDACVHCVCAEVNDTIAFDRVSEAANALRRNICNNSRRKMSNYNSKSESGVKDVRHQQPGSKC